MSTLKVDAIRHNSATSDAITTATDGTCTARITSVGGGQFSHRNIIINGSMIVAQRGTSSTVSGYATLDRFLVLHSGTNEAPTQAQVDVASGTTPYTLGFRKALKITNGNQTSGAATTDYILINYKCESQDIAKSGWNYTDPNSFITLSYWVKSSVAQNFYVRTINDDTPKQRYAFETGSLTADTWTKITKTIPGNSNLVFNNDNGIGLYFRFYLYRGTNYTDNSVNLNQWETHNSSQNTPDQTTTWYTTNDATFEMTGVQLEVGPQATPFEHRSYGEEFRLCQRYYQEVLFNEQNTGGGILRASNSNNFQQPASIQQFCYMRASATGAVTGSNSLVYCRRLNGSSSDITASVSHAGGTTHGFINIRLTGTNSGTFTNEEPYVWWCRESDAQIMFSQDAEL